MSKNYTSVEEILGVLKQIKYKDWSFSVRLLNNETFSLQVAFLAPDQIPLLSSRIWIITPDMTKNELIQIAFKAILTEEENLVRKNFLYNGKQILNSNDIDVDSLWSICDPQSNEPDDDNWTSPEEDDVEKDWSYETQSVIAGTKRQKIVMFSQVF